MMMSLALDIKKEIQHKNYFVESLIGKDNKFIHYYLIYLKTFYSKLTERRFNPLEYSIRKAKNELRTINLAIKLLEFEVNKIVQINYENEEIKSIHIMYKKIILELENNKSYLENLSDFETNKALKESMIKLKLSNFLID